MPESLKIAIPLAGWGTRMRPHTWSKPKQLVSIAGRTVLDYCLEMFRTIPNPQRTEYIFIVGSGIRESQISSFITTYYPDLKAHYVVQSELKGQSHALYLARQYLTGPMVVYFSDTIIETNFSFLEYEHSDSVAWVKEVSDPRQFGVAEINKVDCVVRLIEKPKTRENNLAIVGGYYFKSGEQLIDAIEEQMRRGVQLNNEFFLADAINIMLERDMLMRIEKVETWLDTGTIEGTLKANQYLLQRQWSAEFSALPKASDKNVTIVEPVFIHETAEIENSSIGPYVSISAGCKISGSYIEDSIIEANCTIRDSALKGSFIGVQSQVIGARPARHRVGDGGGALVLNIGDNSSVISASF